MQNTRTVLLSLVIAVALAACGPKATPEISTVQLSGAVTGGKGKVRVTLTNPAAADTAVKLTWSGTSKPTSPPETLKIPAGSLSATAEYSAGSLGYVTVVGDAGETSGTATGNVVSGLRVAYLGYGADNEVEVGATATATLTLNAAPSEDTAVTLTSVNPAALGAPPTVTVPAFSSTVPLSVTGLAEGYAPLTATVGKSATTFEYYVYAGDSGGAYINPNNGKVGASVQLSYYLASPTAADVTVTITSSNPAVLSPAGSLTIPAGSTRGVLSANVLASGFAKITFTSNGVSTSRSFRATAAGDTWSVGSDFDDVVEKGYIGELYVYSAVWVAAPTPVTISASVAGVYDFLPTATAGNSEIYIPITAVNPGTTFLTVTVGGLAWSFEAVVVAQAHPNSFSFDSPTVGQGVSGYLSLDAVVAKDTEVTLTQSGTGHLSLPATVLVGAGSKRATTLHMTADTAGPVTITATANGTTVSTTITINPAT